MSTAPEMPIGNMPAEMRIKLAIGSQFVELQMLQDELAAARTKIASLEAENEALRKPRTASAA